MLVYRTDEDAIRDNAGGYDSYMVWGDESKGISRDTLSTRKMPKREVESEYVPIRRGGGSKDKSPSDGTVALNILLSIALAKQRAEMIDRDYKASKLTYRQAYEKPATPKTIANDMLVHGKYTKRYADDYLEIVEDLISCAPKGCTSTPVFLEKYQSNEFASEFLMSALFPVEIDDEDEPLFYYMQLEVINTEHDGLMEVKNDYFVFPEDLVDFVNELTERMKGTDDVPIDTLYEISPRVGEYFINGHSVSKVIAKKLTSVNAIQKVFRL